MFRNYLTIALRTIFKQKGYSFINIFGLSVGMTCCIFILQFILQFLGESSFMSFIAFLLSILLVLILQPQFQSLTGIPFPLSNMITQGFIIGWAALLGIYGMAAGSYPAFVLSAFQPVKTLLGSFKAGSGNALMRKILVIAQFTISNIAVSIKNIEKKWTGLYKIHSLRLWRNFKQSFFPTNWATFKINQIT